MLGRSNAIAKTHVPTVPLPRTNVVATDTSGHLARRSEREQFFYTRPIYQCSLWLSDEKIQALVQRLSTLENSVRSTTRAPSTAVSDHIKSSTTPEDPALGERPSKRRRTASSITPSAPVTSVEPDTTQQPTTEARTLISKELSTNGLLSGHQRSVLETAISFVDHLSHAPVPPITDRSTFDKSMHLSIDLSPGEILHVILASMSDHLFKYATNGLQLSHNNWIRLPFIFIVSTTSRPRP